MSDFLLRKIRSEDNTQMAKVIRKVMTEFGAVGSGFSIEDPEVDAMFEAYQDPRSIFYVVEMEEKVVGGAGIAQLEGGDSSVCELKKMYFSPEARGLGAGKVLAKLLINEATLRHFKTIYIETLEDMYAANRLYQSLGFQRIPKSLGNTGHCGCDTFYALELDQPIEVSIGE